MGIYKGIPVMGLEDYLSKKIDCEIIISCNERSLLFSFFGGLFTAFFVIINDDKNDKKF